MTIAGVQQGDRLISDKTMGAIVHSGVLSREELSSRDTTLTLIGLSLCLLLGAVLVFLGLRRKRHPSTAKEG